MRINCPKAGAVEPTVAPARAIATQRDLVIRFIALPSLEKALVSPAQGQPTPVRRLWCCGHAQAMVVPDFSEVTCRGAREKRNINFRRPSARGRRSLSRPMRNTLAAPQPDRTFGSSVSRQVFLR